MKGLTHIARLLAAPNVEIHALTLVGGAQDRGSDNGRSASAEGLEIRSEGTGDMGPVLDEQAKAAYRVRIEDLREEIEEADAFNDPERSERARDELEFILGQLAGAVGLGGRDRKTGSDAERARLNVTRAIRSALKRLSEHEPVLGRESRRRDSHGNVLHLRPRTRRPGLGSHRSRLTAGSRRAATGRRRASRPCVRRNPHASAHAACGS